MKREPGFVFPILLLVLFCIAAFVLHSFLVKEEWKDTPTVEAEQAFLS